MPAVQHRPALDAELRVAGGLGGLTLADGEKVFAGQRADAVLRRPRLDLRPRHAATVPVPAPDPDRQRRRRRLALTGATCTRSRSRCRSRTLTAIGLRADRSDSTQARRSGSGRGAAGRRRSVRRRHAEAQRRSLGARCRDSAIRCSTKSSCRWPGKDRWNAVSPSRTREFAKYVAQPELARLLPVLYPGVFPNLAGLTADRADLLADPAHGHPGRHHPRVPELHRVHAGRHAAAERGHPADVVRRTGSASSAATSPGSRTVVGSPTTSVTIELRAVAGATYPLVDPSFTPDGAVRRSRTARSTTPDGCS